MRRRAFLAASGLVLSGTTAGCLGARRPVPAGVTVETRHWVADVLEEGIWYRRREHGESTSRHHELVEDESVARDRIDGDGAVSEFVEGTDFEESYLMIVQNVMQSARWLELRRIERTEPGLDVAVVTASPDEPYGDDAAAHSLAVRVTDERAGVPETLHVTVDGEPTDA